MRDACAGGPMFVRWKLKRWVVRDATDCLLFWFLPARFARQTRGASHVNLVRRPCRLPRYPAFRKAAGACWQVPTR